MKAEEIIELVQSLEPAEIERLFVLIKDYEAEVQRRQTATRSASCDAEFDTVVDQIFSENKELLQKLAEYEAKERASH